MFDDFLKDCPMEDEIKPSKKRVQKNIAALNSLIETEEGTMTIRTKRRFRLERLLIAAVMMIISLSLLTGAYAASRNSVIKFLMGGIEIEGEYYDFVDRKGLRHISFSAELPIDEENFAIIYDVEAPPGENVRIITEETDPDFIEMLRLFEEEKQQIDKKFLEGIEPSGGNPAIYELPGKPDYPPPEDFGIVLKESELCHYNLYFDEASELFTSNVGSVLGGDFMDTEANYGKPSGLRRGFSYDRENGIKIFEESFYYYVGKGWKP